MIACKFTLLPGAVSSSEYFFPLTLSTLFLGGGSALLSLPLPPVSLSDLLSLTKALSKTGASIEELNIVRKNVEVLKGGGLWQLAHPAKVCHVYLLGKSGKFSFIKCPYCFS